MKKSIISAIVFLSLAACMQDEVVSVEHSDAIVFDNAFVEMATRAESFTKDNLKGFNVWGFINNPKASIFESTKVKNEENSGWTYDGTQYWIPGHHYYFAAIAPMSSQNWSVATKDHNDVCLGNTYGPGLLKFKNIDGSEDLIYSATHIVAAESGQNHPVSFNFKHILSKVKFTFANYMGNDYIDVKVSNITLKAPKEATINLASETLVWTSGSEKESYNFGSLEIAAKDNGSSEDLFVIPSTAAAPYEITFDMELVMDGVDGTQEVLYHATKNATIAGNALEIGTAYNFSAAINPDIFDFDCISFCVTDVKDWDNATDLSKIAIASKLGGEITLSGNVEIPTAIEVSRDLVINLNGKTLTYAGADRMFNVIAPATLTINGVDAGGNAVEGSSVVSTTDACIATANTGAAIVINGGDHQTSGSAAYNTNGGNISISAGRFFNWNPANFLVGDLIAEQDNQGWYVVKEPAKDVEVGSIDVFNSALTDANVGEINLVADVDFGRDQSISIDNGRNMVINSKDNDIKAAGNNNKWYSVNVKNGSSLTLNNTNVNGGGLYVIHGSSLVLNNCDIQLNYSEQSGKRYCIYASSEAGQPQVVTINGGSYNIQANRKQAYVYACNTTVNITGGTFGPKPSHPNDSNQPIILDDGGQVIITGGTFGFDPSAWVADGYEATMNGSKWTVTKQNE